MTTREKLGQLILFGFPDTQPDKDALRLMQEYKAGNVILFAHNLENPTQMRALCAQLQQTIKAATGIPALISIDQEGGVVSRLPAPAVSYPSAMAVAATGNTQNAYFSAYHTALELLALGVNCNHTPVLDINTNSQNPVIGVRSYGSDAQSVSAYALEVLRAQEDAGILSTPKHFPGHGDTEVDSHLGLPCVRKTKEELLACELIPFQKAILAKTPCIMIAHILFPMLEPKHLPASMSPVLIEQLLRKELGFEGLVMTDCLEMGAIQDQYGTPEGFVAALNAGVDIACISHTPTTAIKALELAEKAVANGTLPLARIDQALARVMAVKKKYLASSPEISVSYAENLAAAQKMMQSAITRLDKNGALPAVNAQTFFVGCPAYRATIASNAQDDGATFAQVLAQHFGAPFQVTSVNPAHDEVEEVLLAAQNAKVVVAGTYNAHLNLGQIALVNALCDAGHSVIAVALRNPYDLSFLRESAYKLAAFEYSPLSFGAVEAVLRGGAATGKFTLPKGV
ncbi:MAG: glycoside hydrolase family 3 protein [Ruthenibacterium sp.]